MTEQPRQSHYPKVDPQAKFPEIERRILEFWKDEGIFAESVEARDKTADGGHEYVFYDGPPFANGLPHYGHLLTGYVKDVVPRYQTMKGRRVERRFGWDCHGLPAELEAEKVLGISGRHEILELGVAEFNESCRKSIWKYVDEWESYVHRMARWVDFENDYKTMDLSYMESVMWAFKQLHDKGLVYEGLQESCRTRGPWKRRCQQPRDPDWTTRTRAASGSGGHRGASELDPRDGGTLARLDDPRLDDDPVDACRRISRSPSALSIRVRRRPTRRSSASSCSPPKRSLELVQKPNSTAHEVVCHVVKGPTSIGRTLHAADAVFCRPRRERVPSCSSVRTSSRPGRARASSTWRRALARTTMKTCEAARHPAQGLPGRRASGRYTSEVPDYEGTVGLRRQQADHPAISSGTGPSSSSTSHLRLHNYPHCWRTRRTADLSSAIPRCLVRQGHGDSKSACSNSTRRSAGSLGHVRDGQFGKWLENARDWSISRNRYWGAPIPVWKKRRSRSIRGSTSTAASPSSSATSAFKAR